MGPWVVGFAGGAALYAGALVLVVLMVLRLAGRFPGWHVVPLLFSTLFFVFLTQHPFPDPATLVCPVPTAEPRLRPFNFWPTFVQLYAEGAGVGAWAGNMMVASTVMNLVVCVVIGLTLAPHTARIWVALGFGLALTLAVELTQVTGLWGLYPCAYRQFNVDDLMLNVIGVVVGFLMGRGIVGRRGAVRN